MREYKKDWDQDTQLNTYLNLIDKEITLTNFHDIRNEVDLFYDNYCDHESFVELITKIEEDYMKLFYILNYN